MPRSWAYDPDGKESRLPVFRCFKRTNLAPAEWQRVVLRLKHRSRPQQKPGGCSAGTVRSPCPALPESKITNVPQYPISAAARNGISEVIADLEKRQIISRTHSPYNSPVWPVRKPDGRWRLTVDYRRLNANAAPLTAAVPSIANLTATLQAAAHPWVAALDAKDMFFMVPLKEEDKEKFAFTWEGIQYTFHRLPQGYKHSPTIAHAALAELLRTVSLPQEVKLCQYIDDTLIGGTSPEKGTPTENIWFTDASAKRVNGKWQYKAVALDITTGKQVVEEGEGSAQVGEIRAVVLAAQNGAKIIYVDSYAVWAGATQWLCQWETLNWEVNRSPVWRNKDWQLLLDIARKTPVKMGWVKAHAKDNQPATKWNQKVDELTKIRKIILNPEWYRLGEWLHQSLGHTGKEALCFAAQSKGWPINRKTCETILTECPQCRLKLQADHPAKAPPLHINEGKALWSTWQIDYIGPFKSSAGYRYILTGVEVVSGLLMATKCRKADGRNTVRGLSFWFSSLPTPDVIQSDNGSRFSCKEVQDWAKQEGIRWVFHTPYYPQSNGMRQEVTIPPLCENKMNDYSHLVECDSVLPQPLTLISCNPAQPGTLHLTPEQASNPGKLMRHLIEGCLAYPSENQQLLALYWGLACAYQATVQYYQRTVVKAGTQTTSENTLTETGVQTTSEDMIVETGTQSASEHTMVEIGTQTTTTTVIAPVVKKKQWTRWSTGPYHRLVREEEEEEGFDQEASPSAKKLDEGVREFRQEAETIQSLTSSEL
ncbi:hypothetical protein QYF61_007321 [Mycteria americana]|uniref:ribonuclease H n=1 Tax=Mycteria americana TaxID=33587 RepID=A0AAN7MPW8_MYCAM|nr:hypothetical protein QYF61_007321 [Mycteria americana]